MWYHLWYILSLQLLSKVDVTALVIVFMTINSGNLKQKPYDKYNVYVNITVNVVFYITTSDFKYFVIKLRRRLSEVDN